MSGLDTQELDLSRLYERIDRHLDVFINRRVIELLRAGSPAPPAGALDVEVYAKTLAEPVCDLIMRKGRRWRPMVALLMLESLGVSHVPFEELVCVMCELTHTAALIVDDIEDGSRLRRGEECIHIRYGLDVALNAANALYFLPMLLLDHPGLSQRQRLRMHEVLWNLFIRAHLGQASDIYWSRHLRRDNLAAWLKHDLEVKICGMYAGKTAAAVEAAAEFAAIISAANQPQRLACLHFARAFGIAFQIVDDVHAFNQTAEPSKVAGEDLANGKMTYVICTALRRLTGAEHERLADILCDPRRRGRPADLQTGIELVRASGALETCRRRATTMLEDAWQSVTQCVPSSEPRRRLDQLCRHLLTGPQERWIV